MGGAQRRERISPSAQVLEIHNWYEDPLLPALPPTAHSAQAGWRQYPPVLATLSSCRYLPSGTREASDCQFQGGDHLVYERDLCDNDIRSEMTPASSHWRPCSSILPQSWTTASSFLSHRRLPYVYCSHRPDPGWAF